MTSDDFLINHAYQNVWCAPEQDRQTILRPMRITPRPGARGSVTILWSTYNLPEVDPRYHVFQFGNISQRTLGLTLQTNVWTSASSQMTKNGMLIDIYTERGRMLPRQKCYLLATADGNLLVAVEHILEVADISKEEVYFRFYSNLYFDRRDAPKVDDEIEYSFSIPSNNSQISSLIYLTTQMKTREGGILFYVNGWAVNAISTAIVKRNDLVEIIRDSSITHVEEFKLSELPVFLSDLDDLQKYLINPAVHDNDLIHFQDDQDFFLMKADTPNIQKGVFYHKNQANAVRMVTHRDYSIPTKYVDKYTSLNPNWALNNQLTLRVVFRRSGLDKEIINEAHHIVDLYKLSRADRLKAMVGSDAVVDVWRVDVLENAMYPKLMRSPSGKITREMVEGAYGYNAIAKLVADTPQIVETPKQWMELPFGLRGESTVYEYDDQGRLINWFLSQNTQYYIPKAPTCKYIEAIVGRGGDVLSTVYGADHIVPEDLSYRCYVCTAVAGVPRGDWKDITGDDEYYVEIDRHVMWNVNRNDVYTAIKMDDGFLTYSLVLDYADNLLRFSLNVKELRVNGTLYNGLVEIQSGVLELWLNGYSLIEGLDWFMNDKEICIVNRQYRNQGVGGDIVTIRATGFCNADMSRHNQTEFGFVEQGILSRNNRWNLRDDKIVRILANGRIWSHDEVSWDEDKPEVILQNVRDGAPYTVIEPMIPLRGLTLEDTYSLRELAEETDLAIENYMTAKIGDAVPPPFNPIQGRHQLYSPFTAKLMYDLKHGFFDQIDLEGQYTDNQLRVWCEGYNWLLEYEPTRKNLDLRYVAIYPHESANPVDLNVYQYNFLARAVRVFLDNKVDLSQYVTIDTPIA